MTEKPSFEKYFSLPLLIEEHRSIKRVNEPVKVGIPCPKSLIFHPDQFVLLNQESQSIPLQVEILQTWSDRSIKWALLDFQVSIDSRKTLKYKLLGVLQKKAEGIVNNIFVKKYYNQCIIDTNYANFFLNTKILKPFDSVIIQENDILEKSESDIVLTDDMGNEYTPYVRNLTIETAGPVRTTVKMTGEFLAEKSTALAHFVARLSFYAGSGLVEVKFTLHNPRPAIHPGGLWDLGDDGSVCFRDLAMHVAIESHDDVTLAWTSQSHQPLVPNAGDHFELYQDSSGGQNWRSANHVNRIGRVMQAFQGYRVSVDGRVMQEGRRATPIVAVRDEQKSIVAAVDKFWQNFPKALEGRGHRLSIRLFPQQYQDAYELQGGEQKTHTVFLQFDVRPGPTTEVGWVHDRLLVRTTPKWYADSQAINYLTPRSVDKHTTCQELIDTAIEGHHTFFDRREIIDEYGWRHFGDLYADHEAVGHQGDTPLVSHYNNQYDVIYGAIVQYVRSGDQRWFELMNDLAKHVIDIDIYHTHADRPSYNGGMFWHTDHYTDVATATHRAYSKWSLEAKGLQDYGGGPSNEHNYTTGLLLYYFLTGETAAREAVQSLADWVIIMDDGSQRRLGRFDRRPTGLCSATGSRDYHGPGRGAGNSTNALLDAYVLTGEPRYLAKAEELICRCIHPRDDIEKRNLRDVERRWSYTVFLQVLGKYLDLKVERGGIDYMYSYARASLLHYAAWMLENEVPYKLVLDRVEIPTETWPAQDIRKSNVFKFAAKYANEPLRRAFLKKSEDFFRACVTDLFSFETRTLTRPIVLLMTNSFMQAYFEQYPEEAAPQSCEGYDFGKPQTFTPQFHGMYMAREKLHTLVAAMQSVRRRLASGRRTQPRRMRG